MGGAASVVAAPGCTDAIATPLVLVPRGDPRTCVFENAADVRSGRAAQLTLLNLPGQAIIARHPRVRSVMGFRYVELGIGPAKMALSASLDGPFLKHPSGLVFDIAWGKMEEDNRVCLVRSGTLQPLPTKWRVPARMFMAHEDGTFGPSANPRLVLGVDSPRVVLVPADSPSALRLSSEALEGARKPEGAPLMLRAPHEGLALTDLHPAKGTSQFQEWGYREVGVGRDPIQARIQGEFLVRHLEGRDSVLDVAFWKMHVGNTLSFVRGRHDSSTFSAGCGRSFVVHDDGRILCSKAGGLALGLASGGMPLPRPESPPLATPIPFAVAVLVPPSYFA